MKDIPKIICPVCGQEFLMPEIYLPKSFFGEPGEIIKNQAGKVQFYTGSDPDLDEEYICDNCGSNLKISANLTFTVTAEDKFDEEYAVKINKQQKVRLEEADLFND